MTKVKTTIVTLFFCALIFNNVNAQEEKFISLYLYNFTKYIEWPVESQEDEFIIDIVGHKSVYASLKKLAETKKVGARNIIVRSFETVEELGKCHILFVGHWKSRYFEEIINKLENKNTLIVTEKNGLIDMGAAINFIIHDGIIKYELKTSNATKYGLKVNSKLKHLAYVAHD